MSRRSDKQQVQKEKQTFDDIVHEERRKNPVIRPKSANQKHYFKALNDIDKAIVFGVGPAGTGKTLLAVCAAAQAFQNGDIDKIVITRPTVCVGEDLGFLPGKLEKKMEPWTIPVFDALEEFFSKREIAAMMEHGKIEIAPFTYMRGRNFKSAFIIVDEAQNTTNEQMEMVLTRIGEGSKMAVVGDIKQSDRPGGQCGLEDIVKRFHSKGKRHGTLQVCFLDPVDVQRSEACREVLELYK